MAMNQLQTREKPFEQLVVDSEDCYLQSPEKRRYAELELEQEGDVTLLDQDVSASPFKKRKSMSATPSPFKHRLSPLSAASQPFSCSAGVNDYQETADTTLELIDFNTEAIACSSTHHSALPLYTSLLDASFASSPAPSSSYQDEKQPTEDAMLLDVNHSTPLSAQNSIDQAQTPTRNFLNVFATRSPIAVPQGITPAPSAMSCCPEETPRAAEKAAIDGSGTAKSDESHPSLSIANAAVGLPISQKLSPSQLSPSLMDAKASVIQDQKRTLRSRSAIPARANTAKKQLRSANKVSPGMNTTTQPDNVVPAGNEAKTRSTKVPTKSRKRLPAPLATLTTTQSQASIIPSESVKPQYTANQLNQFTSRNTTFNKRHYNTHSTVIVKRDGCRPPSPSAKIRITASNKSSSEQSKSAAGKAKGGQTRSSRSKGHNEGSDEARANGRRSKGKQVQWGEILQEEQNAEEGSMAPCHRDRQTKGILLRTFSMDAAGNALNAKQPLSPIVPREKVVIQRIVYDDDKK